METKDPQIVRDNVDQANYYLSHPGEAFQDGFTNHVGYECVGRDLYEVHQYFLPQAIAKRVKRVIGYFKTLEKIDRVSYEFQRRRNPLEYAENAVRILQRFLMAIKKDAPIIAGSREVCPVAWAVFGHVDGKSAKNYFCSEKDLFRHYKNYTHGKVRPFNFHFRSCPDLLRKIASSYTEKPFNSPNFWMTIAIALINDLINNGGPDCPEICELFNNDTRITSKNVDWTKFHELRCFIVGIPVWLNKVRNLPDCSKPEPVKIFKTTIVLEEILTNNDLSQGIGVKTYPAVTKPEKPLALPYRKIDDDFEFTGPECDMDDYEMGHIGISKLAKYNRYI